MKGRLWDERYRIDDYVYGTAPNAFIREVVRLAEPSDVIELGAGEGRNAVYLATLGHRVTALDYSQEGLRKASRLAEEHGVEIETIAADVLHWQPGRVWDAVVTTFLHLDPHERPTLYALIQNLLRPGGHLFGEWFTPRQALEGFASGGPPRADMMVRLQELREHFPVEGERYGEELTIDLDEGALHRGPAAVVRWVWQKNPQN